MSGGMRAWDEGNEWLCHRRLDAFRATLRSPRDAARLARWRDARLRLLLAHARQQVPLFRRVAPPAAALCAAEGIETLRRFPILSRRDYQEAGAAGTTAMNVAPERLLDRSTSGSTGERMVVRRTWLEERLLNCFKWRVYRDYSIGRRDRVVNALFRSDVDPRDDQRLARLAMALGWRQLLVVDALGPAAAEKTARFAPHCLTGMTSALASLATASVAQGHTISPRLVVTTGELLTAPLRSAIEVLGSPIRDLYGANEFNILAWQCPAGNATYHVCDDAAVVEVLGADGRPVGIGETGEIVVTGLHSFAMPFIRYKIGDRAVRGPERCPCGAPWSTLETIGGRTIDVFPLSGGRSLHPWTIHNAVRPWLTRVRQASLVQTASDRLEYLVVASDALGAEDEALLGAAARAALPADVGFTLRRVDAIPAGPGGKARPFVSLKGTGEPTVPVRTPRGGGAG